MTEFPRLDAARAQLIEMKRTRFKSAVRQWATESVAAPGEVLPLADALWLLPVDVLVEAMEMACADSGAAPFEFTRRPADLYRHGRAAVVRLLGEGSLVAEGFAPGTPPNAGRVAVHPERWESMVINWERGTAGPDPAPITGIVIRRAADQATPNAAVNRVAPVSSSRLRKWMVEWISTLSSEGRQASQAEAWKAARAQLGMAPRRDDVVSMYRDLAPSAWQTRGRKTKIPRNNSTGK